MNVLTVERIMIKTRTMKILVSFSGGRTSAYMAYWLKHNTDHELCFVFANTGKEMEATLEFVHRCDVEWNLGVHWIEYDPQKEHGKKNWFNVVDFNSASRNGEPFAKLIKKEGIPNAPFPHCSGRLKRYPIQKFMRHYLKWKDYSTAIGIRFDEKQRINWEAAKRDKYIYPLTTDHMVDKTYIRHWWDNQSFDLGLKDYQGNCDFCWKKSDRKLTTMIREGHDISWWANQEDEYTFYRQNRSAADLVELANDKRIRSVEDEHDTNKRQTTLFDPLDIEAKCLCNFDD